MNFDFDLPQHCLNIAPPPLSTERNASTQSFRRATSLQFLDPTCLVLSFVENREGSRAGLATIAIKETAQEGTLDELLCVFFELPQPTAACSYRSLQAIADQPCDIRHTNDNGFFYHTEALRVLAFRLCMEAANYVLTTWQFFVNAKVLQHYHNLYLRNLYGPDEHGSGITIHDHKWVIPWEAWRKNTRLMCGFDTLTHKWVKLRHNRVLVLETVRDETLASTHSPCFRVALYDFSTKLALHRDKHTFLEQELDDADVQYHLDFEAADDAHNIWGESIETGLPYRKVTTNRLLVYRGTRQQTALCNNGFALLNRKERCVMHAVSGSQSV